MPPAAVPLYAAQLMEKLARVEGKLDTFLKQMETQDNRTTALEVRTRKVENRQHWYAGVTAAIGAIAGYALELVGTHR